MTYRAPLADISFALQHAAGFKAALAEGFTAISTEEVVDSVLEEAGRFAADVIAPLNRGRRPVRHPVPGRHGDARRRAGRRPTPPGPTPAGTG